ncbi:MAG: adenosylcobinamide-phosphate synthase CbiB [Firmicutes bacterium]|nr:adenosylcobinamide-phosphate synthase CbiB [Bacillota bacterium]
MLGYALAAIVIGFVLDLLLGDPPNAPHVVRAMGRMIAALEKSLRPRFPANPKGEAAAGRALAGIMAAFWLLLPIILLHLLYSLHPWLGMAAEALLCWQVLAIKSLRQSSEKVYRDLRQGDLPQARRDISMIVGRDTENLQAEGVIKAAVETVAENTADGIIAPMFYLLLGGAPLAVLYKAVNTMDSMLGYKNEKYLYFGRAAAKLDDAANFLPSRLAALLMIAAAAFKGLDASMAAKIWRRDRFNHASPNSAQTEAATAGALHVQLAGNAYYFGQLYEKPTIGPDLRPVEIEDIHRSHALMEGASWFMLLLTVAVRLLLTMGWWYYVSL